MAETDPKTVQDLTSVVRDSSEHAHCGVLRGAASGASAGRGSAAWPLGAGGGPSPAGDPAAPRPPRAPRRRCVVRGAGGSSSRGRARGGGRCGPGTGVDSARSFVPSPGADAPAADARQIPDHVRPDHREKYPCPRAAGACRGAGPGPQAELGAGAGAEGRGRRGAAALAAPGGPGSALAGLCRCPRRRTGVCVARGEMRPREAGALDLPGVLLSSATR